MVMDPQNAYAIVVDGEVKHLRLNKGQAEASALLESYKDGDINIRVVPILITEIENVK